MTNDVIMAELDNWAREHARISPDVSTCRYYTACNVAGLLNGKHCVMSYVGRDYGSPGVVPRLVLVGMDHAGKERGDYIYRRSGIEHWYQEGRGKFNPHYKGVVRTAAAVFGSEAEFCEKTCLNNGKCQKSSVPSASCVLDKVAQPNAVKCVSELAKNSDCKANRIMWNNCANHLVEELKILRPDLVIFHGAEIREPIIHTITDAMLEPIEIEGISPPVLYKWRVVGAYLLFLHHPARNWLAKQWSTVVMPALNYLRAEGRIPV
jgi:hypothetical protein